MCCTLVLPSFFADGSQGGGGARVKTRGDLEEQTVNYGENLSNQEKGGVKIEGMIDRNKAKQQWEEANDYRQDGINGEERDKEVERMEPGEKPTDSLSNRDKAEETGGGWSWI